MNLIKSKQRVADHGEVFTPPWLVEAMLDLVKGETERIDSRFLEPACGSGNFLVPILKRKLAAVELKYRKNAFEKQHFAIVAVASVYGIELLPDNITECRANLLKVLADYLAVDEENLAYAAASHVLAQNLIHGDALAMTAADGIPIMFSEWAYLGTGKFMRRVFRLDMMTGQKKVDGFAEGQLPFEHVGKSGVFTPVTTYRPMTLRELAQQDSAQAPGKVA